MCLPPSGTSGNARDSIAVAARGHIGAVGKGGGTDARREPPTPLQPTEQRGTSRPPNLPKQTQARALLGPTNTGEVAQDRDHWKQLTTERVKRLDEWDHQRGNMATGIPIQRNVPRSEGGNPLECNFPGCGKICKSRGGLAIHKRRMHDEEKKKLDFRCSKCGLSFKSENTMINHRKQCGGAAASRGDLRRCEMCSREVSKNNIARHRRACASGEGNGGARGEVRHGEPGGARVYIPKQKPCPRCGRVLSATNMARHLRACGGR